MLPLPTVSTLWQTLITSQLISDAAIAVNVRVLVFGGSWRVIPNAAPFDACTAIWVGLITDSMPLIILLTFDRWILRYIVRCGFGLLRGFACPVLTGAQIFYSSFLVAVSPVRFALLVFVPLYFRRLLPEDIAVPRFSGVHKDLGVSSPDASALKCDFSLVYRRMDTGRCKKRSNLAF